MKTYKVYEQKAWLTKIAEGVAEENLRQYGEFDREIYGNFVSSELKDGKVIGKKLKSGIKRFYAFEEQ